MKRISQIAALISLLNASAIFADHFPVRVGITWHFSSLTTSVSASGPISDSGTVIWQIIDTATVSSPAEGLRITIRESDSISGGHQAKKVDSLYLVCQKNGNGLWFQGDSCWSFAHDPNAAVTNGIAVGKVKIWYNGDSINAVTIDPTECRNKGRYTGDDILRFIGISRFTTADGIGPVAYYYEQYPKAPGEPMVTKQWRLVSTATIIAPRTKNARLDEKAFSIHRKNGHLEITTDGFQGGISELDIFNARGVCIQKLKQAQLTGHKTSFIIDRKTMPISEGIYLVRIVSTDNKVFTCPSIVY